MKSIAEINDKCLLEKIEVLLVDDHAVMRDGIRALLGVHGDIEIVGEACEGTEAVQRARELVPDVVIMDLAMSDMDGLEATKRILKENPRIKILILSQYDNKYCILSSLEAGAVGYVPKNAHVLDLASAIRSVYYEGNYLHPSATATVVEAYRQRKSKPEPYDNLTPREKEVLNLIVEGHSSKEIAQKICISPNTVVGNRAKIMRKLDVHNRTELIKYAIGAGLVTCP